MGLIRVTVVSIVISQFSFHIRIVIAVLLMSVGLQGSMACLYR